MNENSHKISAQQLFCILLLMRITAELVYPTSGGFGGSGVAAVIAAELIRFLIALPVIIYSFRGRSFYAAIWRKNRLWGWCCAIGAVMLLALFAARTLIYAAQFAQRTIMGKASVLLTAALLAGFAAYTAVKGREAAARAGVMFMAAAGIITLLVILADIPYFDITRDMPEWTTGIFITDGAQRLMRGGEYLVFAALLPHIRESGSNAAKTRSGSAVLWFALASVVISTLLCAYFGAVLGEFCSMTEYPAAAAASLADIAILKRLDALFCAIWSLCAAFRVGIMVTAGLLIIGEARGACRAAAEKSSP